MPIITQFSALDGCLVAVWEVTENIEWFQNYIIAQPDEWAEWAMISHPLKQIEWLAGRAVIQHIVNYFAQREVYMGIQKDQHGKPHLRGYNAQISLTHTNLQYVAAALHPSKPVGIDLEKVTDKLERIADRFLNQKEVEKANNDLCKLATYWCAKEALYKLYGKKQLSFRDGIAIDLDGDLFSGVISFEHHSQAHQLARFWVNGFCGVVAV